MTIVGGVIFQLFNGCFYLWASVSNYVLSYMYMYDRTIDASAIFYVDVTLIILMNGGYQIGTYLINEKRLNPKL
jgi:hypothetical protein